MYIDCQYNERFGVVVGVTDLFDIVHLVVESVLSRSH